MPDAPATARLEPAYDALRRADWAAAREHCRPLLDHDPEDAPALHAAALASCGERAFDCALPLLERAVRLTPPRSPFARDLAVVQAALGRWRDVVDTLADRAPDLDVSGLVLYLRAATEAGCAAEALARVDDRLARMEPSAELYSALGRALLCAGRPADAQAALESALTREPGLADAHEALATLHDDANRGDAAFGHWQALARLQPSSGYAQLRLALALSSRGRLEASRAARLEALRLGLSRPGDYSAVLYLMLFDPEESGRSVLDASRRAFPAAPAPACARRPQRSGRRRIGYVSGEFRATPAYYFLRPFLEHHDRDAFEVFAYHTHAVDDHRTASYRSFVDHWRDVHQLTDDAILSAIDRDRIDVLVDLSGHLEQHRLPIFARRAAPVQATFPNYPATTGCREIDYFFTDWTTSPEGTEDEYAERLCRLPSGYLAYAPPVDTPNATESPARRDGRVTFGLLQRPLKITRAMWDAVAAIMRRTPRSRLLFHVADEAFDRPESRLAGDMRRQLADRGIDPARLTLRGPLSLTDHAALVSTIDVALDTHPFSGQTTTSECLWQGAPVVTLAGATHASRVSAGLLARAGLRELVTRSYDEYVSVAADLAADVDRLVTWRQSLRPALVAAGFTDGRRLASEIEDAYEAWTAAN